MTKPDIPRARISFKYSSAGLIAARRNRSSAFFPVRNRSTQSAEMPCEITVASAAPFTPMSSAKIKMGSKRMFRIAPIKTVSIPVLPNLYSMKKDVPMIDSALLYAWAPLAIEQSGAPPIPKRLANALIIVIMGSARPTPVKASVAAPGICPI